VSVTGNLGVQALKEACLWDRERARRGTYGTFPRKNYDHERLRELEPPRYAHNSLCQMDRTATGPGCGGGVDSGRKKVTHPGKRGKKGKGVHKGNGDYQKG